MNKDNLFFFGFFKFDIQIVRTSQENQMLSNLWEPTTLRTSL